jgi:hypothetical protein
MQVSTFSLTRSEAPSSFDTYPWPIVVFEYNPKDLSHMSIFDTLVLYERDVSCITQRDWSGHRCQICPLYLRTVAGNLLSP